MPANVKPVQISASALVSSGSPTGRQSPKHLYYHPQPWTIHHKLDQKLSSQYLSQLCDHPKQLCNLLWHDRRIRSCDILVKYYQETVEEIKIGKQSITVEEMTIVKLPMKDKGNLFFPNIVSNVYIIFSGVWTLAIFIMNFLSNLVIIFLKY